MAVFIKREYDYAIRICAYLAGKKDGLPVPISEISKKLLLTKPFATKVIYNLKTRNILLTTQGKQGGVQLARDPASLSFFEILYAMGFDSTLNECVKIPGLCPLNKTCKIHRYFIEQEQNLINNFKKTYISDFIFYDHELLPFTKTKTTEA